MRRQIKWLFALGLLSGCATVKTRTAEIPVGNVISVYQPPTVSRVTFELIGSALLIAIVVYALIERALHKKSKRRGINSRSKHEKT